MKRKKIIELIAKENNISVEKVLNIINTYIEWEFKDFLRSRKISPKDFRWEKKNKL